MRSATSPSIRYREIERPFSVEMINQTSIDASHFMRHFWWPDDLRSMTPSVVEFAPIHSQTDSRDRTGEETCTREDRKHCVDIVYDGCAFSFGATHRVYPAKRNSISCCSYGVSPRYKFSVSGEFCRSGLLLPRNEKNIRAWICRCPLNRDSLRTGIEVSLV